MVHAPQVPHIPHTHSHFPGQQLVLKLAQYMRPKCHALLLDSGINSDATVRLNIYQAFVLTAMKLHCYVRSLGHLRGAGGRPVKGQRCEDGGGRGAGGHAAGGCQRSGRDGAATAGKKKGAGRAGCGSGAERAGSGSGAVPHPVEDPRLLLVALQSAISYMHALVKARTTTASQRFGVQCRCAVKGAGVLRLPLYVPLCKNGEGFISYITIWSNHCAWFCLPFL